MMWNSVAKVQRHASVITPIRLGNRTELELKRFVPLALLFPIALRYWEKQASGIPSQNAQHQKALASALSPLATGETIRWRVGF